jgi:hypothetical protein
MLRFFKWRFLFRPQLISAKWIATLALMKNGIFLAEDRRKSQKTVIITLTPDFISSICRKFFRDSGLRSIKMEEIVEVPRLDSNPEPLRQAVRQVHI